MRNLLRTAVVAVVAAASLSVVSAPASAAPPPRADSQNRPVLLIHGYASGSGGHDCNSYWSQAKSALPAWGWTGPIYTVGYYDGDRNCNATIRRGDHEVPIESLGYDLAWWIYNNHSRYGRAVDIIAHSMGGLVARAALTGDQQNWSGWPPYVYVEDVATLGAPHGGTAWWTGVCFTRQCRDMQPGSQFLSKQADNAQSTSGTDWTLIGADSDAVVSTGSALAMNAVGHKLDYDSRSGLSHSGLINLDINAIDFKLYFWNYYDAVWHRHTTGSSPLRAARNAIYSWSQW